MEYLREAAQFFRDEDAQFELAKLYLRGDGIESDVPYAKHWLSVLSQKGHAGAQAFLADLLWRGKYMKADPVRALALISVAVANAPPYERVWIEDIYQNIYCGAGAGHPQAGDRASSPTGARATAASPTRGTTRASARSTCRRRARAATASRCCTTWAGAASGATSAAAAAVAASPGGTSRRSRGR